MYSYNAPAEVSIIMCFLNTELFIAEAIESVLRQQYKAWELILIDDGSSDGSTYIATEAAAFYPQQIHYYEHEHHQNCGTGISRNLGIAKASGKYIAFLDADDVWRPNMLADLLALMERHQEVAMICEASEYWYSWNEPNKADEVLQVGAPPDQCYRPPELMWKLYPLGPGAAPCICGLLIRREAVDKCGGFDDDFKGMYDDQTLLVKLYLEETIFISSHCNNRYRQRPSSLVHTSQGTGSYYRERLYFLTWLASYLKENRIYHPTINQLLTQALRPYNPTLIQKAKATLITRLRIAKRIFLSYYTISS